MSDRCEDKLSEELLPGTPTTAVERLRLLREEARRRRLLKKP